MSLEYALSHPNIADWKSREPFQWRAFLLAGASSDLGKRAVAAVLASRQNDESLEEIARIANALKEHDEALLEGRLEPSPSQGLRRSFEIRVVKMKRVNTAEGAAFRVDFVTNKGWSGYFDTSAPEVVERIAKQRRRSEPLTIVGEVVSRPFEFLVVLGGRVKIV